MSKMGRIDKLYLVLMLLLVYNFSSGQGLVQCDGHIVFENGGHLVIDGTGNYYDTLDGRIDIRTSGNIWVPGDWINVSTDNVFSSNDGHVTLTGANQRIRGTSLTAFPTLELTGSNDKILEVNALVGGGYNNGGTGKLICNNRILQLNSQRLTINNTSNSAITQTGGGIVSETNGSIGYGTVDWVVRTSMGNYVVPFRSAANDAIFFQFDIQTAGINTIDSGLISVSTYPTATNLAPNNRELPIGVTNTFNEFGVENASRISDRFWVVAASNFSKKPVGVSSFGYLDPEWNTSNSSTNDILENNLRPMRYNIGTNEWLYSRVGSTNAVSNSSYGSSNDFEGIWTLSDSTICPRTLFSRQGNCENTPILFTDNSTITKGTIDQWDWSFGDGGVSTLQDAIHFFSAPGLFNVKLRVVGNSGCPDSLTVPFTVDARAEADFSYDDDPLVDIPVKFTSSSQNATSWDWDFGDFNNDNIEHPKHTYGAESSYDVTLIANNNANCPDTITKTLEVNLPSLFLVPTAFSPGTKDNLNTDFGLTTLQRVSEFTMTVYNRWGEQVFHSDDISKRWDGTYQGAPAPSGSYLYIIWFRDRTRKGHALNGSVVVLR
ncbi:MAG: gliding motility-associated-like protein [Bacteroidia bacterium]|jgi:gliding motility-associated-like protein